MENKSMPKPQESSPAPVKNEKPKESGIKVVALREGFFEQRRIKEGDIFTVPNFDKLGSWMKCLDADAQSKHLAEIKKRRSKVSK